MFGKIYVELLQLEYNLIHSLGHKWPFLMPVNLRKCHQFDECSSFILTVNFLAEIADPF
jgi:hypothetical protein